MSEWPRIWAEEQEALEPFRHVVATGGLPADPNPTVEIRTECGQVLWRDPEWCGDPACFCRGSSGFPAYAV